MAAKEMSGVSQAHVLYKPSFTPQPIKEKKYIREQKPKILILAGPTCVGKTRHSILIAQAVGGEIVSADSMQVYQGMNIGTAKATVKEQELIPHHLIDIRDLHQPFNVAEFYKEAMEAIHAILGRGHVPIVVGGSGFYIHALLYGPPQGPPSQPQLRKDLERELAEKGSAVLYERLVHLDPDYAHRITYADRHKIIRALEIIALTNQKVSQFSKAPIPSDQYQFYCWFLTLPKEILYSYIEMRCDEMIAAGFIEEVRLLAERGLKENPTASQAIGYRQCLDFIESPQSAEDFDFFVSAFKRASRRYAKKQFTWFRKEPAFRWLDIEQLSMDRVAEIILQDFEQG